MYGEAAPACRNSGGRRDKMSTLNYHNSDRNIPTRVGHIGMSMVGP